MSSTKNIVTSLRKKDYTLSEIMMRTGLPKTTIYEHIRDIPLSPHKRQEISNASKRLALKMSQARRGKSARTFTRFDIWTTETVFILSHLLFDGDLRRVGCSYNNRNGVLLNQFEKAMLALYAYPPTKYLNRKTGVSRVSYYNVALGEYLQHKSKLLLKNIASAKRELRRVFLKSFFDDEGCMDFRPSRNVRQIRGYQKDTTRLLLIQKLLVGFGIASSYKKPNEIVISGKENLVRFQKEIGFTKGVRINGSRSNSIWRQPLEKRILLKRAIATFKS